MSDEQTTTADRKLIVDDGRVCWLYPDGSHRCVTQADVDELNGLAEYKAYRQYEDEILRKEREEERKWDASMNRLRKMFS